MLVRIAVVPEPILAIPEVRWEYTVQDTSPSQGSMHIHNHTLHYCSMESSSCMFWGRKLENSMQTVTWTQDQTQNQTLVQVKPWNCEEAILPTVPPCCHYFIHSFYYLFAIIPLNHVFFFIISFCLNLCSPLQTHFPFLIFSANALK